jgi:hypothetical protein
VDGPHLQLSLNVNTSGSTLSDFRKNKVYDDFAQLGQLYFTGTGFGKNMAFTLIRCHSQFATTILFKKQPPKLTKPSNPPNQPS